MLREKELKWFYQYGASEIYPEAWQGFLKEIAEEDRHDLIEAYRKIFNGDDEEKKLSAAKAWSKWEASCSVINYNPDAVKDSLNAEFALAFALIENHYFVNKGFLDNENQLLEKCKSEKPEIIESISSSGKLDEDIEKNLASLINDLKEKFKNA